MLSPLIQQMQAALSSQIVGGGLVLMLFSSAMYLLREVPKQIGRWLVGQVVVVVDVVSSDPLYGRLTVYFDQHAYTKRARRLTASERPKGEGRGKNEPHRQDGPTVLFSPAPGHHFFMVRGRPIWMNRERKEVTGKAGEYFGYQETITLRTFGRSADSLRDLLHEAHAVATQGERAVGVWMETYGEWRRVREMQPRALQTVVLPRGVVERVLYDVERFLGARDWYEKRGMAWRLTHQYDGPPGTGKNTLVAAVAAHFEMDLYLVNVAGGNMSDQKLADMLMRIPERSAVFFDDLDRVVDGETIKGKGEVTYAGLLGALDGAASKPGVLTFITANHPERLGGALTRAGRVDFRLTLGHADEHQAVGMFNLFYPEAPAALAAEFGRAGAGRAPADLTVAMTHHADDPHAALEAIRCAPCALAA